MEPGSIILMVVSVLIVWGGLVASVVALHTMDTPTPADDDPVGAMTD